MLHTLQMYPDEQGREGQQKEWHGRRVCNRSVALFSAGCDVDCMAREGCSAAQNYPRCSYAWPYNSLCKQLSGMLLKDYLNHEFIPLRMSELSVSE